MRYYGEIGYSVGEVETEPGVFQNDVKTAKVTGNIIKARYSYGASSYETTNKNVHFLNRFSILPPESIIKHLDSLVYIVYRDIKWAIRSFTLEDKRLIIEVGEVYNE